MSKNEGQQAEYIRIQGTWNIEYKYSTGAFVGRFLREIRDNGRLYAIKCPKCGRLLIPPRIVCGVCHVKMEEWVELNGKGTLLNYTVTTEPMYDPSLGAKRSVPYAAGVILLDGGNGVMIHCPLEETDPEKLRLGMRVQAVFKPVEKRSGLMTDLMFSAIKE